MMMIIIIAVLISFTRFTSSLSQRNTGLYASYSRNPLSQTFHSFFAVRYISGLARYSLNNGIWGDSGVGSIEDYVLERDNDYRQKRRNEMPLSQRWYKAQQQHVSKAQKKVLRELWPIFGIDLVFNETIDGSFKSFYGEIYIKPVEICILPVPSQFYTAGSDSYIVLDIGFGTGESICQMANRVENSKKLFIGCEIYRAGLASALALTRQKIDSQFATQIEFPLSSAIKRCLQESTNIRLIRADATLLFERHLSPSCLNEICVFFPDPWPNIPRDLQRRVVRLHMLDLFARALRPGGLLRIATDVEEYATYVRRVVHHWNSEGLFA